MEPSLRGDLERRMVTRVRGRPIPDLAQFDWMSEFQIAGQAVLRPQALNASQQQLRSRMIGMLNTTSLGVQIVQLLVTPTVSTRNEHDAYIRQDGTLIGIHEGRGYGIDHHNPPAGSSPVGYVHTHPASTQIRPPTVGRDWLNSVRFPVQLMVESRPGRVWGLISPNLACVLGLVGRSGTFYQLNPSAPQAGIIYAMTQR